MTAQRPVPDPIVESQIKAHLDRFSFRFGMLPNPVSLQAMFHVLADDLDTSPAHVARVYKEQVKR